MIQSQKPKVFSKSAGPLVQTLLWTTAVAMLGSCSHSRVRRSIASEGEANKVYSANFSLFRYPEVPQLLRVFHGTLSTHVARLEINNPGQVVCQSGTPTDLSIVPSQPARYRIETSADQDIYCYLGPNSPTAVNIKVDYYYSHSTTATPVASADDPQADVMRRTLRQLESNDFQPETVALLQSHGQASDFALEVKNATGTSIMDSLAGAKEIALGDVLMIRTVSGALGLSKKEHDNTPFDSSGLPAKFYPRPSGSAPVASYAVKHDKSYLFADERPLRVICSIQDGDESHVVFRGGDTAYSSREVKGDLRCQLNLKEGQRPFGSFKVEGTLIHYADALREFGGLVRLGDQGAATAREQEAEDRALREVTSDVGTLLGVNTDSYQAYLRMAQYYKEHSAADIASHQQDLAKANAYFPSEDRLDYRRGAFNFRIVPTPVSYLVLGKPIQYVNYEFQDMSTDYIPENKKLSVKSGKENWFHPVTHLQSRERAESANMAPLEAAICPDKIWDAANAIKALNNNVDAGIFTSRKDLLDALAPYTAPNPSKCEPSKDVDSVYFYRQNKYIFHYSKSTDFAIYKKHKVLGRDPIDTIVYAPDRIEALYESSNLIKLSRILTQADNAQRVDKLAFFEKPRPTGLLVTAKEAGRQMLDVPVWANTLFPPLGADGALGAFPSNTSVDAAK